MLVASIAPSNARVASVGSAVARADEHCSRGSPTAQLPRCLIQRAVVGVVETGLFIGIASNVVVGRPTCLEVIER
jgi:ribose 5-phosphate isomerase